MFHFADFASYRISELLQKGCPIRIFTDQKLLAFPRNVSPLAASFIAVRCHGHPPYALNLLVLSLHRCLVFYYQHAQGNLACPAYGGDDRIRTDDLWLAKPPLSH